MTSLLFLTRHSTTNVSTFYLIAIVKIYLFNPNFCLIVFLKNVFLKKAILNIEANMGTSAEGDNVWQGGGAHEVHGMKCLWAWHPLMFIGVLRFKINLLALTINMRCLKQFWVYEGNILAIKRYLSIVLLLML